jgi:hypothetical protein
MEKTMDYTSKPASAVLSRRAMLRNVSAGGAVILGTVIGTCRMAEAQTKATKQAVSYQDKPHDDQRCDNCLQFEPPSACKVVEGSVSPSGWCLIWAKKPT